MASQPDRPDAPVAIAITTPAPPQEPRPFLPAGRRPADLTIPGREEWDHLLTFSEVAVNHGWANKGLNSKEKAALAILKGREVGISPLMALQEVYVVHGKPGLSAVALTALLQNNGCRVETVEYTDAKATVRITRPSGQSDSLTFTMADAQRMRTMEDGKSVSLAETGRYKQNGALMLWNRALSRLARRFCADITFGMGVAGEEDETTTIDVTPSRSDTAPPFMAEDPGPAAPSPQAPPPGPSPADLLRARLGGSPPPSGAPPKDRPF